jgi:hypothetical protein
MYTHSILIFTPCSTLHDVKAQKEGHHLKYVVLKMAVAVLTGHAAVRRHLHIMGLFDGDPTCRFCRMETETVQHMTCCCEVLACQRYNVFGTLFAEAKDIRTATVRDLCLFIGGTGLLNLC